MAEQDPGSRTPFEQEAQDGDAEKYRSSPARDAGATNAADGRASADTTNPNLHTGHADETPKPDDSPESGAPRSDETNIRTRSDEGAVETAAEDVAARQSGGETTAPSEPIASVSEDEPAENSTQESTAEPETAETQGNPDASVAAEPDVRNTQAADPAIDSPAPATSRAAVETVAEDSSSVTDTPESAATTTDN
ncbi:MAG: hypothetical protein ACKVH1_04625, partial [Alphaproteobacteria bacterium]